MIDRLSIRTRPDGKPVMHQTWGKLLFLHWAFPAEVIRPLVPARLEIDTFDGQAWVGLTPFTMWDIRPRGLPAVPIVSRTHELNVRTYVHLGGVPGVWFLSLDASNTLAVLGARVAFALPYFQAAMSLQEENSHVHFFSHRMHPGAPIADFDARWEGGVLLGTAEPDSLDFFLVERYCLYAQRGKTLYRSRIHHPPWPLRAARLEAFASTMLQAHGLPEPGEEPILHMLTAPLQVEVWPLEAV